ncbi:MAG: LysR family transcriptional regulator [Pikeienuella sp.]
MNLAALHTFQAIVETGSLIRASERLNVTQSTVTARLKALEEDIGQPLFLRQKSGARLTAAGAKFRRYADAMIALWGQAKQDAGLPEGVGAVCNIGCHQDLWPNLGARALTTIQEAPTTTAITAWPCEAGQVDEWLTAGLIDLAFTHRATTSVGATSYRLPDDRLILVSTDPNAPLRHDPGYVFVDAGEAFGRAHHVTYADADTAQLSFGAADWALAHITKRGGTAYLPERVAEKALADGVLSLVSDAPVFSRPVWMIVRDDAVTSWPWFDRLAKAMKVTP